MNELWQEICFTLKSIPSSSNEELYEQKIIESLGKLGWSAFKKEIALKVSKQLGSTGKIIPDIVVKSLDTAESFVIEVKRPSIDIDSNSHKSQLFSYMRQLKLTNGLLIGNKIQIYYDGPLNTAEDPILLKSIGISETDKSGDLFIELFQKKTFSYQTLEGFAKSALKEISDKSHKEKLIKLLTTPEYQAKMQQVIADDLEQNWDSETIKNVLEQLSFSITRKNRESQFKNAAPTRPSSLPSEQEIKIGELVKGNLPEIIDFCNVSEEEFLNLQSKEYSKMTFKISYPFLQKLALVAPKYRRKFWKEIHIINNEEYIVTSQWFDGDSRPLFLSYMTRMRSELHQNG